LTQLPLVREAGHLFTVVDGLTLLVDTGAPLSFALRASLDLHGTRFELPRGYMGLDVPELARLTGHPLHGLLGMDVLSRFDVALDLPRGTLAVSTEPLPMPDSPLPVDDVLGIPVVDAQAAGRPVRLFFDTGASLSYLQEAGSYGGAPAGDATDFYPGFGEFDTPTWMLDVEVGPVGTYLRCGALPDLLSLTLQLAGVDGIAGNTLLAEQPWVLSMRRKLLATA
jgi:hypothetical protein